jgi:hypothetical protein
MLFPAAALGYGSVAAAPACHAGAPRAGLEVLMEGAALHPSPETARGKPLFPAGGGWEGGERTSPSTPPIERSSWFEAGFRRGGALIPV